MELSIRAQAKLYGISESVMRPIVRRVVGVTNSAAGAVD
jgi:hypothetical protein